MRIHGNLKKWNDDRGFGFIAIPQSADDLFVHISAFPKDGVRPTVGELISFEIQTDKNGEKRAIQVLLSGSGTAKAKRKRKISKNGASVTGRTIATLALILAYIGYKTYISSAVPASIQERATTTPTSHKFACDGREHCSQMNSRAEAEYFVTHCPNTKMDGDNDGIPCENDSRF